MKKRILAMLLAVVMVIGLMPAFEITASAATLVEEVELEVGTLPSIKEGDYATEKWYELVNVIEVSPDANYFLASSSDPNPNDEPVYIVEEDDLNSGSIYTGMWVDFEKFATGKTYYAIVTLWASASNMFDGTTTVSIPGISDAKVYAWEDYFGNGEYYTLQVYFKLGTVGSTDPAEEMTGLSISTNSDKTYWTVNGLPELESGYSWLYRFINTAYESSEVFGTNGIDQVPSGTYEAGYKWYLLDEDNTAFNNTPGYYDEMVLCKARNGNYGNYYAVAWARLKATDSGNGGGDVGGEGGGDDDVAANPSKLIVEGIVVDTSKSYQDNNDYQEHWYYTPGTNGEAGTLTIRYSNNIQDSKIKDGLIASIYCEGDLNIKVDVAEGQTANIHGTNNVGLPVDSNNSLTSYGIYCTGNLKIYGEKSQTLSIKGRTLEFGDTAANNVTTYGIYCGGNLTVESCSVKTTGNTGDRTICGKTINNAVGYGVYCGGAVNVAKDGSLVCNGPSIGTVGVKACRDNGHGTAIEMAKCIGLYAEGLVTVDGELIAQTMGGNAVKGKSAEAFAAIANGDVLLNRGSVDFNAQCVYVLNTATGIDRVTALDGALTIKSGTAAFNNTGYDERYWVDSITNTSICKAVVTEGGIKDDGTVINAINPNTTIDGVVTAESSAFTLKVLPVVTFDANGGAFSDSTTVKKMATNGALNKAYVVESYNDELVESDAKWPVPTRVGYKFVCWSLDDEGTNYDDRYLADYFNADTNLYAVWEKEVAKFDPCNGGTVIEVEDSDSGVVAPTGIKYIGHCTDTVNGYYFDGWYTMPNGWGEKATSFEVGETYYASWKTAADGVNVYSAGLDFTDSNTPKNGTGYIWDSGRNVLAITNLFVDSATYFGVKVPHNTIVQINGQNNKIYSGDNVTDQNNYNYALGSIEDGSAEPGKLGFQGMSASAVLEAIGGSFTNATEAVYSYGIHAVGGASFAEGKVIGQGGDLAGTATLTSCGIYGINVKEKGIVEGRGGQVNGGSNSTSIGVTECYIESSASVYGTGYTIGIKKASNDNNEDKPTVKYHTNYGVAKESLTKTHDSGNTNLTANLTHKTAYIYYEPTLTVSSDDSSYTYSTGTETTNFDVEVSNWNDRNNDAASVSGAIYKIYQKNGNNLTLVDGKTGSVTFEADETYATAYVDLNNLPVGNYVLTVSAKDPRYDDGNTYVESAGFEFTIAQATVARPTFTSTTSATYDGQEKSFQISGLDTSIMKLLKDGVEVSNPTVIDGVFTYTTTNAGSAKFTVQLKDSVNHVWQGGNTNPEVTFTINPKKITPPTPQFAGYYNYRGEEITYAFEANGDAAGWEYVDGSAPKMTNAGSMKFKIKLTDPTNTVWSDTNDTVEKEFTFKINTKKITRPTFPSTTSATYDGQEKSFQISGLDTSIMKLLKDGVEVSNPAVTDGKFTYTATNAGSAKFTVQLKDSVNYAWSSNPNTAPEVTFTINPKKITPPTAQYDYYYNGAEQTYTFRNNGDANGWAYVDGSAPAQTNAGDYKFEIKLKDPANTTWNDGTTDNLEYTFRIKQDTWTELDFPASGSIVYIKDSTLELNLTNFDEGENRTLFPADPGTVELTIVEDANKDLFDVAYNNGNLVLKVKAEELSEDEYTVTVKVESTNYYSYNIVVTVDVIFKSVTVGTQSGGLTYSTGDDVTYSVTNTVLAGKTLVFDWAEDVPDDVKDTVTATWDSQTVAENGNVLTLTTTSETPAGEYKFNVSVEDGTVYTSEGTITIDKLEVVAPTEDETEFIYNSKEQTYKPVGGDTDWFTVSGNTQTVVGDYTVTVALNDKVNTIWKDTEDTNDKKFDFEIDHSVLTIQPQSLIVAAGDDIPEFKLELIDIIEGDEVGFELIDSDNAPEFTIKDEEGNDILDADDVVIADLEDIWAAIKAQPGTYQLVWLNGDVNDYNLIEEDAANYSCDVVVEKATLTIVPVKPITAEFTFTYEETIGKIVDGEELPDLSVLTTESVVVKDVDGNVLPVSAIEFAWVCKAPEADEGWIPDETGIAVEGVEYGIVAKVSSDKYAFAWDDPSVVTCADTDLDVYAAWINDGYLSFGAVIATAPMLASIDSLVDHAKTFGSFENGIALPSLKDMVTAELKDVDGNAIKATVSAKWTTAIPTEDGMNLNFPAATGNIDAKNIYVLEITITGNFIVAEDVNHKTIAVINDKNGTHSDDILHIYVSSIFEGGKCVLYVMDDIPETESSNKVESTTLPNLNIGGLDEETKAHLEEVMAANPYADVDVDVKMTVETKTSDKVDAAEKTKIESIASAQSKNLKFVDIVIKKTVTINGDSTEEAINETKGLMTIEIPFDTAGKNSFKVYRHHAGHADGDVQVLTETANAKGEKIIIGDGKITIKAMFFSTYAIGYTLERTVSFNANGGTGTIASVIVNEGTKYTLPACSFTAPVGKLFKAWNVDGTEYAAGAAITVAADTTVKAVWKDIVYTVKFSDGAGKTETATVKYGEKLILPACSLTAPAGKEFKAWNVNGVEKKVGDAVAVSADMTITAVWKDIPGSITVPKTENGKLAISGERAEAGDKVTITVTPDEGYKLDKLTVTDKDGKEIEVTALGNDKYSFVMPKGDAKITASFSAIITICPKDETCPIHNYTDSKTTAWYHDGVHYCIENGLMIGVAKELFAPNGITTRAQIVTILWRMEGEPAVDYTMSFKDVKDGKWYTEAIRWAQSVGVVEGYNADTFGPNNTITREQMATILWRYSKYKGIDVSVGEDTNILSYEDAANVKGWAMDGMQWAFGAGIIVGIEKDNSMYLDPQGNAVRSQSATMIYRFCTEILK